MFFYSATVGENPGICAFFLTLVSVIIIVLTMPFSFFFCIKVSDLMWFLLIII